MQWGYVCIPHLDSLVIVYIPFWAPATTWLILIFKANPSLCGIKFVYIFWVFFVSVFMSDIDLKFSFLVTSLSDFGIRKYCPYRVSWEGFPPLLIERLVQFLLKIFGRIHQWSHLGPGFYFWENFQLLIQSLIIDLRFSNSSWVSFSNWWLSGDFACSSKLCKFVGMKLCYFLIILISLT